MQGRDGQGAQRHRVARDARARLLGVSNEMPLIGMWATAPIMGIADGPTEVHKVTIARQVLKGYKPQEGLWPRKHLPGRVAAARERFACLLDEQAML